MEHLRGYKRFSWPFRQADLRWRLENSGVETFFTWPVVHETIYTGDSPQAEKALAILKEDDYWDTYRSIAIEHPAAPPSELLPGASGTMIYQMLHLAAYAKLSGHQLVENHDILEFGGGYGALAKMVKMWGHSGSYAILDLPELIEIQDFYLGERDVWLITLIVAQTHVDLLVALNSLSEVSYQLRDDVLYKLDPDRIFLLYTSKYNSMEDGVYDNHSYFTQKLSGRYEVNTLPSPIERDHTYLYAKRI